MSITIENVKQHTLEWVNAIRTEHGNKPLDALPKGSTRDPQGCVIYNALVDVFPHGLAVNGSALIYNHADTNFLQREELSYHAGRLVALFDEGRMPELVKSSW